MSKKKIIMVLDSESLVPNHKGFNQCNNLVYELSYKIIDLNGKQLAKRGFLISEALPLVKTNKYYTQKASMYYGLVATHELQIASIAQVYAQFLTDIVNYQVNVICNHNVKFDSQVLTRTLQYFTNANILNFYPIDIELYDTMYMSKVITNRNSYNYLTKKGNKSLKLENLMRYIKGNDYTEKHIAYYDIDDTTELMVYCLKQHKPMNRQYRTRKAYHYEEI